MSVERSWLIAKIPDSGLSYNEARHGQAALKELAEGCYLVPNVRLQAIADAWNDIDGRAYDEVRFCAPKLTVLLDALTKDYARWVVNS